MPGMPARSEPKGLLHQIDTLEQALGLPLQHLLSNSLALLLCNAGLGHMKMGVGLYRSA